MRSYLFVLLSFFSASSLASLELQQRHLVSNEPWVVEQVGDETLCHVGFLKILIGDRGVGFSGMHLPMHEKVKLVVDQNQVFELQPEEIYVSATYLLSNSPKIKSAVLNANVIELSTRNCENRLLDIFSIHGCSKTIKWTIEEPLGRCEQPTKANP